MALTSSIFAFIDFILHTTTMYRSLDLAIYDDKCPENIKIEL